MGYFIATIGLFVFIFCLIWLFVRLIKRKPKKQPALGMLICFIMIVVGVVITPTKSGNVDDTLNSTDYAVAPEVDKQLDNEAAATKPSQPPQTDKADLGGEPDKVQNVPVEGETHNSTTSPADSSSQPKDSSSSDEVSLDTVCSLIEITLSENYSGCEVFHDNESITANVWYDGLAAEITAAQLSGSESYKESWQNAVNNVVELSNTICGFIDEMGRTDVYFTFNVLNDANRENVFLTILEGVVLYDVLE